MINENINHSNLPYGNPRPCEWCDIYIDKSEDSRNVMLDCRQKYKFQTKVAYGNIYQIVCKRCFDWSSEHEDLDGNQIKLMKKWSKSIEKE